MSLRRCSHSSSLRSCTAASSCRARAARGTTRWPVLTISSSASCSGAAIRLGSRLYGLMLAATLIWGVYEVGADPWALARAARPADSVRTVVPDALSCVARSTRRGVRPRCSERSEQERNSIDRNRHGRHRDGRGAAAARSSFPRAATRNPSVESMRRAAANGITTAIPRTAHATRASMRSLRRTPASCAKLWHYRTGRTGTVQSDAAPSRRAAVLLHGDERRA